MVKSIKMPSGATAAKLPGSAHTSRRWRIHEVTSDFRVEDVWALPTPGGPGDFPRLVEWMSSFGTADSGSFAVRALFEARWKIGRLFGWDERVPGSGSDAPTLRDRLPEDLREGPSGPSFESLPFEPLFLTENEFAAEIVNRTVHGVLHLSWVEDGAGGYRSQMAVLVKRNGRFGDAYMAAILPFRYLIVYPLMARDIDRGWSRVGPPAAAAS